MSTCPRCGQPANPLQLSLYTTVVPYRCGACRKTSRFDRRTLAAIGGLSAAAGALAQTTFHFKGATLLGVALVGTVAVMAGMYCGLKLQRATAGGES